MKKMDIDTIKTKLKDDGFVVIPNILSPEEIEVAKKGFKEWQATIPDYYSIHRKVDPHGIHKFHEIGHQWHSWYIRTNPKVQTVFKELWNTDELIVSFDGSCYISKDNRQVDKIWTHTDQAPNSEGLQCYQGFVALTSNCERTLVVYEGSHKLHSKYFEDRGITCSKNWQLIDLEYLKTIEDQKRVLEVPEGSLVLWDSRTFHQNQYGKSNSEERIVQYVCYLPKNHKKNTESNKKKRRKYFEDRRTTSHWPCPLKVNGKQPQTYGDTSRLINYELLKKTDLEDIMEEIEKIL